MLAREIARALRSGSAQRAMIPWPGPTGWVGRPPRESGGLQGRDGGRNRFIAKMCGAHGFNRDAGLAGPGISPGGFSTGCPSRSGLPMVGTVRCAVRASAKREDVSLRRGATL